MSRKVTAAALALTLAGGVYLAGTPAEASNMGFKLERSFDLIRGPAPEERAFTNKYWVSFPYFNGLGDVGNSDRIAHPGRNRCVGDTVGGGGPPVGDGIIDSTDLLCDLWTSRTGSIQVAYYNQRTCAPTAQTASVGLGGFIDFTDTEFPVPVDADGVGGVDPGVGYELILDDRPGTPTNRGVIVGSHDPAFPGQPLHYSTLCGPPAFRRHLVSLPYHTMLQTAAEFICGLEGVDWLDDGLPGTGGVPNDGLPDHPDDCQPATGAIFDGQIGAGHALQVETFVNEVGQASRPVGFTISAISLGGGRISPQGTNFLLRPGDAYLVTLSVDHQDTNFLSPHF